MVRTIAFSKFGCGHSRVFSFSLLITAPFEYTQHCKVMAKPLSGIGPNSGDQRLSPQYDYGVNYLLAESSGCNLQPSQMRSISVRFVWKEHAPLLLKVGLNICYALLKFYIDVLLT